MRLKRIAAPAMWRMPRKTTHKFTYAPLPGPHGRESCITLGYALRDMLGIADTEKEIHQLLNAGTVSVDGRVRKSPRFPIGLMDIVSVGDSNWRVMPDKKGFRLQPAGSGDSSTKLLKVLDKSCVDGKIQLNLHDGTNMLVDKDIYRTSDVLVLDTGKRNVKNVLQFKRGMLVLVTDGVNRGKVGKIEEMVTIKGGQPNRVILKMDKGNVETLADYVIVVGLDRPVIELGVK